MNIDTKLLKKQIKDLLNPNINEDSKTGLHHLLGEILDKEDNGKIKDFINQIQVKDLKGFPKVYNPVHNHIVHMIGEITLPMCKPNLKVIKKIVAPLSIVSLSDLANYCRELIKRYTEEEK